MDTRLQILAAFHFLPGYFQLPEKRLVGLALCVPDSAIAVQRILRKPLLTILIWLPKGKSETITQIYVTRCTTVSEK
jgi:hypothetical protein